MSLARRLNRKVAIKYATDGQDEIGQPTQVEATLATVYANIRYLNGVESIKAGATTAITKASIRIRRRMDVTASMWVEYEQAKFQITQVLPDEQSREHVDLVCEVVA